MKNIIKVLSAITMMISLEALADDYSRCKDKCYKVKEECKECKDSCEADFNNCISNCQKQN